MRSPHRAARRLYETRRYSPAATARGEHPENIPSSQSNGALVEKGLSQGFIATRQQPVLPDRPRASAGEPPRLGDSTLGDEARRAVLQHLEVALDSLAAAGQGTMNNLIIGGVGWVYYETIAGGQGASPHGPGESGLHTGMTNTRNTPIEALERAFPLRVRRYKLRLGSGGAGLSSGGEGIERDVEVLEDCTASLITERRVSQPWGLAGGGPGAVGENWLLPGGDEALAERLLDKCTVRLRAGDVLRMLTPGGGGWGAPPSSE